MKHLSRRALLGTTPLIGMGLLAGCATTTNGGNTTATLDVAKIVTDGTAVIAALTSAIAAPSIETILGANYKTAQTALAAASSALAQVQQATGGTASVSIDTTSVQSIVSSLLADAKTVLGYIQAALPNLPTSAATAVGNFVSAAQTLLPFIALAASLAGAAPGKPTGLTEAQALKLAVAK